MFLKLLETHSLKNHPTSGPKRLTRGHILPSEWSPLKPVRNAKRSPCGG